MNRQGVCQILGSAPPADPGSGVTPTCYAIGGCSFSESSFLRVTIYQYVYDIDCNISIVVTGEKWTFSSRTATEFTWSGALGSATYNGTAGQWTFTTVDPPYIDGGSCLVSIGAPIYTSSCGGFSVRRSIGGIDRTVISAVVEYNNCIPPSIA